MKACPGGGGCLGALSLTYRAAAQSLFLHRISVVRGYLSIAATTQDPAAQDLHHSIIDRTPREKINKDIEDLKTLSPT